MVQISALGLHKSAPKLLLDRFGNFCRAQQHDRQTQTDTHTTLHPCSNRLHLAIAATSVVTVTETAAET